MAQVMSSTKSQSPLSLMRLTDIIGAEIIGADVSKGLDDASIQFIRTALHDHAVIVLRDQRLSPHQQTEFVKLLGEPRISFYNKYAVPGQPELSIVSNILQDGDAIGIIDAGMLWHTDGSYLKKPDLYTVLYGIEIPLKDGKALGDTVFASTRHAYIKLSETTKTLIEGLRAVHSFERHIEKKKAKGNLKRAPLDAKQKAALPDVDHPVVRTHPFTGHKCIFVTDGHTSEIVGMPAQESDSLIKLLTEHVIQPEFQYRHTWRPGDLIVWDNCSVQHLAVFDYGDTPRRLHRSGIQGPIPI